MEQINVLTNQMNEQGKNVISDAMFLEVMAVARENKVKAAAYIGPTKYEPKVAEGHYFAITKDAQYIKNKQTKNGLKNCIETTYSIFVPNSDKPVELTMLYWEISENRFYNSEQLSVLLEADATKGFKVCDLIGKYCQVEIKHTQTNDGRIFANVEEISLLNPPTNLTNSIEF